MGYKVITPFIDLQDKNHGYEKGDTYPRDGTTPSEERIKELSGSDNRRKMSLIIEVKEQISMQEEKGKPKKTVKKEG